MNSKPQQRGYGKKNCKRKNSKQNNGHIKDLKSIAAANIKALDVESVALNNFKLSYTYTYLSLGMTRNRSLTWNGWWCGRKVIVFFNKICFLKDDYFNTF